MRVSNIGGPNWQQGGTPRTPKKEADFLKLWTLEGEEIPCTFWNHKDWIPLDAKDKWGETVRLFACKEYKYNPEDVITLKARGWIELYDTNEQLSKRFPHCSFPMDVELVHVDLSALTDERKAELNEKYQISDIKAYSEEYFALIKDLQEAGILSDGNAYQLPPNLFNAFFDADGRITRFDITFPPFQTSVKNGNFLDYTKNALSFAAEHIEDLSKCDRLTRGEQMAVSVYEMNQNIVAAMEEIFAAQLGLGE